MMIYEIDEKLRELGCDNETIFKSFVKANAIINGDYETISCSISGGSDSDIILDICTKFDFAKKIRYVWFDTGLEYQATKDHIKELEKKYGIEIERRKAIKPIPVVCKEYGLPFLNKFAAEQIERLQKHNFTWEDKPLEKLLETYPNCKSSIYWWCNAYKYMGDRPGNSSHNIGHNKWLKEFLILNPPTFKISAECCSWAKKKVGKRYDKEHNVELKIVGVRKSEGGIRASHYTSCFGEEKNLDSFRPIFWYRNVDKKEYETLFGVTHSECYTKYGFTRTGCVCCPFARDFDSELEAIEKYEPKLYKAANFIFGESYEYTRKYRAFCEKMDAVYGNYTAYMRSKAEKND